MRMRFSNEVIYFQFSIDNSTWQTVYCEIFSLPGVTISAQFYYEIATTYSSSSQEMQVDDFKIENNSPDDLVERPIFTDPLNASQNDDLDDIDVIRKNEGGNFSTSGWKPVNDNDLLYYDLSRYIKDGILEVDVKSFNPYDQNSQPRHHILRRGETVTKMVIWIFCWQVTMPPEAV